MTLKLGFVANKIIKMETKTTKTRKIQEKVEKRENPHI
jgi:hypothetical protein